MVRQEFEVYDFVWVKLSGKLGSWPGRVEPFTGERKEDCLFISLYGSDTPSWVPLRTIRPHSEEEKAQSILTNSLQRKIDAIEELEEENRKRASYTADTSSQFFLTSMPKEQDQEVITHNARKRTRSHLDDASETENATQDAPDDAIENVNTTTHIEPSSSQTSSPFDSDFNLEYTSVRLLKKIKNSTLTKYKIGFIGLGVMGARMARNIIKTGHEVVVWNRNKKKSNEFEKIGAAVALTPADIGKQCDLIFSCLSSSAAVHDVVFGSSGVLEGISDAISGKIRGYIEMTNIDPETAQKTANALSVVGARYLEAPINGSRDQADDGDLLIVCCGNFRLFNDSLAVLNFVSKIPCFLSSRIGKASTLSLASSMFTGAGVGAMGEFVACMQHEKLDGKHYLRLIENDFAVTPYLIEKGRFMTYPSIEPNESLVYQQQRIYLAMELYGTQSLPLTTATNELYKDTMRRYGNHDDLDVSTVYKGVK